MRAATNEAFVNIGLIFPCPRILTSLSTDLDARRLKMIHEGMWQFRGSSGALALTRLIGSIRISPSKRFSENRFHDPHSLLFLYFH
jgi:hypothetical protein